MIKSLSWGKISPIPIRDIESKQAFSRTRQFIAAIGLDRRGKLFDVYLCADQRNGAVRNVLNQLGNVRVFSNAGNVVYAPSRRPLWIGSMIMLKGTRDRGQYFSAVPMRSTPRALLRCRSGRKRSKSANLSRERAKQKAKGKR